MPVLRSFHLADYELIICGSGLFGLTVAQEYVQKFNRRVLIIEKRNHPGGNSWSEFDEETGIEIHKYGSHLFHTSNEKVWAFVNRFSNFVPYRHKVIARTESDFYNLPINLMTLSRFFGRTFNPEEAKSFLNSISSQIANPSSFEEAAISQIGQQLYETFFKGYTQKQWQVDPRSLSPEIYKRIPVRFNFEDGYFNDTHQGLPETGYSGLIQRLISHEKIDLVLDLDFQNLKRNISGKQITVYTGPIDQYFDFKFGPLGWRTLDFTVEKHPVDDYQGNAVVNYVDVQTPFTRIHEFKHLHPERKYTNDMTIIMKEYSRFATENDEPYYPINTEENRIKLKKYRELISKSDRVFFGGRLGSFQYLDMHMAIASALTMFANEIVPEIEKLRESSE